MAFSPDGELLASGGYVPIRLYRVASSATEPVASAGATGYATGLLFSPDGRYLGCLALGPSPTAPLSAGARGRRPSCGRRS